MRWQLLIVLNFISFENFQMVAMVPIYLIDQLFLPSNYNKCLQLSLVCISRCSFTDKAYKFSQLLREKIANLAP